MIVFFVISIIVLFFVRRRRRRIRTKGIGRIDIYDTKDDEEKSSSEEEFVDEEEKDSSDEAFTDNEEERKSNELYHADSDDSETVQIQKGRRRANTNEMRPTSTKEYIGYADAPLNIGTFPHRSRADSNVSVFDTDEHPETPEILERKSATDYSSPDI